MKKKPRPQSWRDEIRDAPAPFVSHESLPPAVTREERRTQRAKLIASRCQSAGVQAPLWVRLMIGKEVAR